MSKVTLNCLGESCPTPLIRIRKKMGSLRKDDILVVKIDHSCALKSIPEWAHQMGYEIEIIEISSHNWEVIIEKAQ